MWDTEQLAEMCGSDTSILDLGCYNRQSFRNWTQSKYVGVDIHEAYEPDVILDLRITPYPFDSCSFDIVTSLDSIEHLEKRDGLNMIKEMMRIAKWKVIVFTGIEFKTNEQHHDGNDHQLHKSLWTPEDFEGWEVIQHEIDPTHNFYVLER